MYAQEQQQQQHQEPTLVDNRVSASEHGLASETVVNAPSDNASALPSVSEANNASLSVRDSALDQDLSKKSRNALKRIRRRKNQQKKQLQGALTQPSASTVLPSH
jgi:hypothetical protein